MLQSSVSAAKYHILTESNITMVLAHKRMWTIPSESHNRTKVIRAVSDVNDTVKVCTVAFEERVQFHTYGDST